MVIVVGLIVAFVLVLVFSNRRTRNCRWRADRTRDVDGQHYHRCMACGAEAFTSEAGPPKDCFAGQRDRPPEDTP